MTGTIRFMDKWEQEWYPQRFSKRSELKKLLKEKTLNHYNRIETGEWTISILMDADNDILTTTRNDARALEGN